MRLKAFAVCITAAAGSKAAMLAAICKSVSGTSVPEPAGNSTHNSPVSEKTMPTCVFGSIWPGYTVPTGGYCGTMPPWVREAPPACCVTFGVIGSPRTVSTSTPVGFPVAVAAAAICMPQRDFTDSARKAMFWQIRASPFGI